MFNFLTNDSFAKINHRKIAWTIPLKCVLGPQEPLKKISRLIFFFYSVRLSVTRLFCLKKKKIICLKCVLGPQEPLKKFSRLIFFFTLSVRLSVTRLSWGGLKKNRKNLCV